MEISKLRLKSVQVQLAVRVHDGLKLGTGTIVDATIIGAPRSTKNADKKRNPNMHQTRKGQYWYFGIKMHIGVDSRTGLAHSAVVTASNVHDKHPLPELLHGNEQRVYGDSAYTSQKALIQSKAPKANESPRFSRRLNTLRGLSHEEDEQVLA